jgi:hypothetical protein
VLLDEQQDISSQEFVYIVSLILFYSCIYVNIIDSTSKPAHNHFQICCENLDASSHQLSILKFFGALKTVQESKESITKEVLRAAIKEAVPPSPLLKFISASPVRTPDKTPPTPYRANYHDKTKEVQRLKTQLENERYERNMLEADMRQSEQQIKSLRKFLCTALDDFRFSNNFYFNRKRSEGS